mgnify:CR=1 FL=1
MTKNLYLLTAVVSVGVLNACSKVSFESQASSDKDSCVQLGIQTNKCGFQAHDQMAEVKANLDVDVLFVIDNSGSMKQEQIDIANKISGFMDKIKNLNWQIALTTTDDRATTKSTDGVDRAWSDGQFRPFDADDGVELILKASLVTAVEAQTKLGSAIQVGLLGSGNERAINATYRAVERAATASVNKDFLRPGARLAVVAISDEDECSKGHATCNTNIAATSEPQNLVNLVKSQLGADKVFTFNSIIDIPGDVTCTTGANEGNSYQGITTLTGGVLGSVCSTDFTAPLSALGTRVVELVKSVALECAPEDLSGDGIADIRVILADGTTATTGYQVSGNTVSFNDALPEGQHRFAYYCMPTL